MELYCLSHTYISLLATLFICTRGAMFDFHFIEENGNSTTQEKRCRELGYDGFAVLSTPEAFEYALKVTDYVRNVLKKAVTVGAHYNAELGITLWDDGTVPTSDSPFYLTLPTANPDKPVAIVDRYERMKMSGSVGKRPALCGNHRNYPSQSSGSIVVGKLETTFKNTLYVTKQYSYLECVLLCGMTYECRAAEFNLDTLACAIIGKYTTTGTLANPETLTYVRQKFR